MYTVSLIQCSSLLDTLESRYVMPSRQHVSDNNAVQMNLLQSSLTFLSQQMQSSCKF